MSATIATLLRMASNRLADTSLTASLDAEILLANVLEIPRSHLYARPEQIVEDRQVRLYALLVVARSKGRPIAHITGSRDFWSLTLKVTPATLIPRPETELLVEEVLRIVPVGAHWYIADLGTGCGAIALSLAIERPNCKIVATDISKPALDVARENADRLQIKNVEFLEGEWFIPVANRRFSVIVSNPPYIPNEDPHLREGDLRFEPRLALTGGPDGLAAIRKIVLRAPTHLDSGGTLLLEHGYDQAEGVRSLLAAAGFTDIHTALDLAGINRVSSGRFEE
ncbi:MAG: peptide chain release factor N(5)-glutamine methyltransferase [Gammaproteobacteria bacterium]|nr:peptide chain release factor N(5)-glutamine methyltransferase [Gammaproteobacteria bacterium]MDE2345276.1 peptide chain release factor N(5)-glutamine methyltransferase [Gammaproteobacteria bacterium]